MAEMYLLGKLRFASALQIPSSVCSIIPPVHDDSFFLVDPDFFGWIVDLVVFTGEILRSLALALYF